MDDLAKPVYHFPGNIEVGHHPHLGRGYGQATNLELGKVVTETSWLVPPCNFKYQDIGFHGQDMPNEIFWDERFRDHVGVLMVSDQFFEVVLEGKNPCGRQVSGLPHTTAQNFSIPPGLLNKWP